MDLTIAAASQIELTWWAAIAAATNIRKTKKEKEVIDASISEIAQKLLLASLDTTDSFFKANMFDFHHKLQPVLLVDRLGPRPGMVTSLVTREVEELDGNFCSNLMQLGSLLTLGYRFGLLTGGFVLSTVAETKKVRSKDDDGDCKLCGALDTQESINVIASDVVRVTTSTSRAFFL